MREKERVLITAVSSATSRGLHVERALHWTSHVPLRDRVDEEARPIDMQRQSRNVDWNRQEDLPVSRLPHLQIMLPPHWHPSLRMRF